MFNEFSYFQIRFLCTSIYIIMILGNKFLVVERGDHIGMYSFVWPVSTI